MMLRLQLEFLSVPGRLLPRTALPISELIPTEDGVDALKERVLQDQVKSLIAVWLMPFKPATCQP